MDPVVTSEEMQARDRFAIGKLKINSLILMENAGRSVADMIKKHYGYISNTSFLIICGKGNNGGDGYVAARHLFNNGATVTVLSLGKINELKNDAKTNYKILENIVRKLNPERLHLIQFKSVKSLINAPKTDYVIDAIFGTGFSGGVMRPYSDIINWINSRPSRVVSIDIPSGVNADNGEIKNTAVRADLTVTMAIRKIGLLCGKGADNSGLVEKAELSIPAGVKSLKPIKTFLIGAEDIRAVLPIRPRNAHKHSVGKILVIAGSPGFTGAAAMTSVSAMRAGAGAVVLGTPKSVYPILARKLTEVMVESLPDTNEGTLGLAAYDAMNEYFKWADLIICGPGISQHSETSQLVWRMITECNKPMLIDADGLNNLSEKISLLKNHRCAELILTPHTGELSRITGMSATAIENNRISVARKIAQQYRVTLVLKGAPTVVAEDKGLIFINSTGNPGMASAGMGDVLAGIIGGLWAQGMKRTMAAYAGVFIHGYAGDLAREKFGQKSLLAVDVQNLVPRSLLEIERKNRI